MPADKALAVGILDQVEEGDPVQIGIAFAHKILAEGRRAIPLQRAGRQNRIGARRFPVYSRLKRPRN